MIRKIILPGLMLALASSQLHAEPATVVRSSQLRSKPFVDAPLLSTIAEGESVDLISNEGGWSKIKVADGKIGFIRLLNVRPTKAGNSNTLADINKLGNVVRTGSTGAVATTGVKGITKDDIAKSEPNPAEVKLMESYATSTSDARKAAKSVKLAEQVIPFIEDRP